MTRPLLQKSAEELEKLAEKHWSDAAQLQEIVTELGHRSTPRAMRLERRIAQRLSEFQGTAATPGGRGGSDTASAENSKLKGLLLEKAQALREREEELRSAKVLIAQLQKGSQLDHKQNLFAQVGLNSNCPEFVVRAAKRAWMKEYHPDTMSDRPESERRKAEEVFKATQNTFDQIEKTFER